MAEFGDEDLEDLFRHWVSSDLKVQIVRFFHANPGVIETTRGLAMRLGVTEEALKREVDEQVGIGILRRRRMGDLDVLSYDRGRHRAIEGLIERKLRDRLRGGDGA